MAIKFDLPTRYDEQQALEGVWFDVIDEHEQLWGKFKLAFLDGDNPNVKKLRSKLEAKYAKDIRLKRLDQDKVALEIFIQCILLDWSDVKAGGKEVPFTQRNVEDYFAEQQVKKFVFPELLAYCSDVRFYNDKAEEQDVDPVADKDEELGNS